MRRFDCVKERDMRILRGKRALVTGAANGIGRALAEALAREGVDLYLLDIDEDGLARTAAACRSVGVEVFTAHCDLTNRVRIQEVCETVRTQWGGLDLLVNNAGVCYQGPTHQMSLTQWERMVQINLTTPVQMVLEWLPTFMSQRSGHVLNVASIAGLIGASKLAGYTASKFGLVGFSESLRIECARHGVVVTTLCPGFVRTGMLHNRMKPDGSREPRQPPTWMCLTPEKVAAKAVSAIRRDRGTVVTPLFARLAWTMHRIAPGFWPGLHRVNRWMRNIYRSVKPKPPVPADGGRKAA